MLDKETRTQLRECDEYVQISFGRDFGRFDYEPWNKMMDRYGTPEDEENEEGEEEVEETVGVGGARETRATAPGTSGTTRENAPGAKRVPRPTPKVVVGSPVATKGKKKGKGKEGPPAAVRRLRRWDRVTADPL
jgi:hypothetical protein